MSSCPTTARVYARNDVKQIHEAMLGFYRRGQAEAKAKTRRFVEGLSGPTTEQSFLSLPFEKKGDTIADWLKKTSKPGHILSIPWLREYIDGIRDGQWKAAYGTGSQERDFLALIASAFAKTNRRHDGAPKPGRVAKSVEDLIGPANLIAWKIANDGVTKKYKSKRAKMELRKAMKATKFELGGEFNFYFVSKKKLPQATLDKGDGMAIMEALEGNIEKVHIKQIEAPMPYKITKSDMTNVISWWTDFKRKFMRAPESDRHRALVAKYLVLPSD